MSNKLIPTLPENSPFLPTEEARFINRELSWLAFNTRVLEEAENPKNPLYERVKFLSICASNLDEFFMVRVAGLKDHVLHNLIKYSDDGLTSKEQLAHISLRAQDLRQRQQLVWVHLKQEMRDAHLQVIVAGQLKKAEREWLADYFMDQLFPVLTPIAIDPAHPFPFLPNLGIAMMFRLVQGEKTKHVREQIAVIPLPATLARFIVLPATTKTTTRVIRLEDVIALFIDELFPSYKPTDSAVMRITRDSDLEVHDEAEDLARVFEHAIKRRRRGRVIQVKTLSSISGSMLALIAEHLQVGVDDINLVEEMVGLSHIMQLYDLGPDSLKFTPFQARTPERIQDFGGDCFAAIAAKDILVHHPFESFDVVVRFLRQAAADPNVISIKQTLYRTSDDSPIVRALIEAAEAGKSVTALIELKARFDEEANIKWARDLERAGAQVVYGFVKLKTHAKVSQVIRREDGKLKAYVHLGTGNYHPKTARVYTDLSYFTCDPDISRDVSYFFNFVTGYATPRELKKLVMAPNDLRNRLLDHVAQEIAFAKAGKPANIWAKMNAIVDPILVDALYAASQAGVQIHLVVRGICALRPGVPGLSENIHVKSVIGRFLEHSRIFCFGNSAPLPSDTAKIYIASADWMVRNFDMRVEVMTPIENATVHDQILDQIMNAYMKDDTQSWTLLPDGSYKRIIPTGAGFSAHDYFLANPSLSGRGKALKKIGAAFPSALLPAPEKTAKKTAKTSKKISANKKKPAGKKMSAKKSLPKG